MLTRYLSASLLFFSSVLSVQGRYIEPRAAKQSCTNTNTNFAQSMGDWVLNGPSTDATCQQTSDGLVMRILPPHQYLRAMDPEENLPYNKIEGLGCTMNATTYMQYGKFSATVKSAGEPGAVTAVILIADNGDEIDFELLAGPKDQITSNYFYGPHIVYGVNGDVIDAPQGNVYDQFYTYSIEWSPEKIVWSIDGNPIRTTLKSAEYPTHPARVQIGLWDGSGVSGTARWARGPIDWSKRNNQPVEAVIKDVQIECDPVHNDIA